MAGDFLALRLPGRLADRLRSEAAKRGMSTSALVREILSRYFVSEESFLQEMVDGLAPRLTRAVMAAVEDAARQHGWDRIEADVAVAAALGAAYGAGGDERRAVAAAKEVRGRIEAAMRKRREGGDSDGTGA